MNIEKTNVTVDNTPIYVNNVNVEGYTLAQYISIQSQGNEPGQRDTTKNRGRLHVAYAKYRDIFKSNLAICMSAGQLPCGVVPAMTYNYGL